MMMMRMIQSGSLTSKLAPHMSCKLTSSQKVWSVKSLRPTKKWTKVGKQTVLHGLSVCSLCSSWFVFKLIVLYQPFVGGRVKVVGHIESCRKILWNICHPYVKSFAPWVKSFGPYVNIDIVLHIIWMYICLSLRENGHIKLWCMKRSFYLIWPILSVEGSVWVLHDSEVNREVFMYSCASKRQNKNNLTIL